MNELIYDLIFAYIDENNASIVINGKQFLLSDAMCSNPEVGFELVFVVDAIKDVLQEHLGDKRV